jgi:immunity protein 49 of polymorphic toxin system
MTARPPVDTSWAEQLAIFCAESYEEYVASDPSVLGQVDHVFAADYALDCALVTYALGADPDDVRVWIKRAAFALGEVFRLRGTTPVFPVVVDDGLERQAVTPPGKLDASLTNSRRGLLAMQLALIAGDPSLVEQVAARVGDPPNATYIGPDSEVCTTEEQGLAYAVKAYLLGETAVAYFHTAGLAGSSSPVREQAVAIDALIDGDERAFLSVLDELLAAHTEAARDPRHVHEPRFLVAIPALALAALANRSGVIDPTRLPDTPYLPRALLPAPAFGT